MKNLTVQSNQLQTTVFSSGACSGARSGGFRRLFILLAILTLSVGNMWGEYNYSWYGNVFFRVPDDWDIDTYSTIQIGLARTTDPTADTYVWYFSTMDRVGTTRLFHKYVGDNHDGWNQNEYVFFSANTSAQGNGDKKVNSNTYYTTPVNYGFSNDKYAYIFNPTSEGNAATTAGDYSKKSSTDFNVNREDLLHKSQTINLYTNGSLSYAGGTITISGTYTTGTTTTASGNITSSSTDVSYGCAIGSTVTLTASVEDGYHFIGWFEEETGGEAISTSLTYSYTCTGEKNLYARFESLYNVTPTAGEGGASVTPSVATSIGQVEGGDITATAYPGYSFSGWTVTTGTATFDDAASATTKVYPSTDATIQANFVRKYAYLEGRFRVRTAARSEDDYIYTNLYDGNWGDNQTNIPFSYDAENHLFYLHTYQTPAEISVQLTNEDPWIFVKACRTMGNLSDHLQVYQHSGDATITGEGTANKQYLRENEGGGSVKISSSENEKGYAILYFDEQYIWYELECALSYDANGGTGDAPDARTYYSSTATPAAEANTYSKDGYRFTGWNTAANGSGASYAAGASVTMNAKEVVLYAQWDEVARTSVNDGDWDDASTWSPASVPTKDHDVTIAHNVTVTNNAAHANSVNITYGTLTIDPDAALVVETTVKVNNGSTTAEKLHIKAASGSANGALIWGSAGTPGEATVEFYTISGGADGSADAVNQYIGIPFTSLNSSAYTNAWILTISGTTWEKYNGDMAPWTGYNIIQRTGDDKVQGYLHTLTGELVANNASVGSGTVIDYDDAGNDETVYANSWVAPILIKNLGISGTATVYIFNSRSKNDDAEGEDYMGIGNYAEFPVNESPNDVIPSMQSFSLWGGSLTSCSYDAVVRNSGAYSTAATITNATNRAPKRIQDVDYREAIWATQDTLSLCVKAASGWGDQLRMYIHEDFSTDYENGWDGPKVEGMEQAPQMYAATEAGNMAVNCVPTLDNSVIGFHAGTAANEYTMSVNYSGEEELTLVDNKTKEERLLTDGDSFTFTSEAGDSDLRFSIVRRSPQIVTAVGNTETSAAARKIVHNGQLRIVREGRIYDATGARVK